MTTGEYMKAARKNAKLTRGKLSEISGVSLQSIYNCEHDIFSPTLFTVMCLADALKISIDEYIGRKIRK